MKRNQELASGSSIASRHTRSRPLSAAHLGPTIEVDRGSTRSSQEPETQSRVQLLLRKDPLTKFPRTGCSYRVLTSRPVRLRFHGAGEGWICDTHLIPPQRPNRTGLTFGFATGLVIDPSPRSEPTRPLPLYRSKDGGVSKRRSLPSSWNARSAKHRAPCATSRIRSADQVQQRLRPNS